MLAWHIQTNKKWPAFCVTQQRKWGQNFLCSSWNPLHMRVFHDEAHILSYASSAKYELQYGQKISFIYKTKFLSILKFIFSTTNMLVLWIQTNTDTSPRWKLVAVSQTLVITMVTLRYHGYQMVSFCEAATWTIHTIQFAMDVDTNTARRI